MGRRLLVWVDALSGRGTGHVMRSLALADEWTEEHKPSTTFVMAAVPGVVASRIRSHGHRIETLDHDPGTPDDLKAAQETIRDPDREHVTPYIRNRPDRFPQVPARLDEDLSHLRLTVDTRGDIELTQEVDEQIPEENPSLTDATNFLDDHPEIASINRDVQQKEAP